MRSAASSVLVLTLLVAACADRESNPRAVRQSAESRDPGHAAAEPTPASQVAARKRTRKVSLHLAVHDVAKSRAQLEQSLLAAEGFLQSVDTSGHGASTAVTLVARVPDAALD